ncbi:uncharacterized protein LOC111899308 [Lactuca sativa]|uniref:uncharacterized protein LOC111899308 n=1 Tax=Lactuca sativa TaxID=4236 RepID=UPI000CD936D9|nr:uncharacterized protein LOC111899308 [Lactuca sativa]
MAKEHEISMKSQLKENILQKPKRNLVQKPSLSKKPIEKPISHQSQPKKSSFKDIKGKGKLVPDSKALTKKSTTNSWKVKKEFVKNQIKNEQKQSDSKEMKIKNNEVKVFTINKKDETTLVIHDEQFYTEWYIDNGCSHHMTGRKEELREFRALNDGGNVKYGNKSVGNIKGYGMITNGYFSVRKVEYVDVLQDKLISVSQLVVGMGLKVSFDDEGSEII